MRKTKKRNKWLRLLFWSIYLLTAAVSLMYFIRRGMEGTVWHYLPLFLFSLLAGIYAFLTAAGNRRFLVALDYVMEQEEGYAGAAAKAKLTTKERRLLETVVNKIEAENTAKMLKTEAELHALQNQINPHFLYNTLEVIRGKALIRDAADVAEMTEALATLFRYNINRPGEMATFDEELDNVNNYMLIQNYRFANRFRFVVQVEDEAFGIYRHLLPLLTLQPIVENAIYHGLNEKTEGGTIELRAFLTQEKMIISIRDDGVGMKEETLARLHKKLTDQTREDDGEKIRQASSGIALDNVNRRIKFYYGDAYGLEVFSTEGTGTKAVVTVPRMTV